jgi:hypothetical protein
MSFLPSEEMERNAKSTAQVHAQSLQSSLSAGLTGGFEELSILIQVGPAGAGTKATQVLVI